jgi:hypothetical protein
MRIQALFGAYQELARGFGIRSYRDLQESGRANEFLTTGASERE